jgi:hypothetical protein
MTREPRGKQSVRVDTGSQAFLAPVTRFSQFLRCCLGRRFGSVLD